MDCRGRTCGQWAVSNIISCKELNQFGCDCEVCCEALLSNNRSQDTAAGEALHLLSSAIGAGPSEELMGALAASSLVFVACIMCMCCYVRRLRIGARLLPRDAVNDAQAPRGVTPACLGELQPAAYAANRIENGDGRTGFAEFKTRKKKAKSKSVRFRYGDGTRTGRKAAFALVIDGTHLDNSDNGENDDIVGATDVESADDGEGGNNYDRCMPRARRKAVEPVEPVEGSWLAIVVAFEHLAMHGVLRKGEEGDEVLSDVEVELFSNAIVLLSHVQCILGPFMHPAAMNDRKFVDIIRRTKQQYGEVRSLRLLLELERAALTQNGMQPYKDDQLPDDSVAICSTWLMRGLSFWTGVASRLSNSQSKLTLSQAATQSYEEHLEPFHRWLLRKAFGAGIAMVPSKATFFDRMMALPDNPPYASTALADKHTQCVTLLKRFVVAAGAVTASMRDIFLDLALVDARQV